MNLTWRRGLPVVAGLCVLASALWARALFPDPFERARLAAFDAMQRAAPWEKASPDVRVVDIDDASLKRVGQWPWPRSTLARLTVALRDLGAAAIVFDVVFAEPDRTSPARLVREWEGSSGAKAPAGLPAAPPDYDADLAAAFAGGRVVTGFGLTGEANGAAPAISASFATIGGDPAATVRNYHGAIPNLPGLEAAAAGNGTFSITAGRDPTIRRLPLLVALNGKLVPSLALEALRVAQDEDTIAVRAERESGRDGEVTGYTLHAGAYDAPVDVDGALILHHGSTPPETTISAWRLLEPDQRATLASAVRGKIALVGTSAVGLSDLRSTPLNPLEPGVELHARALEQILSGHFLSRPAWAGGAEIAAAVVLSCSVCVLAAWARLGAVALALPLTLLALASGAFGAFAHAGMMFDPSLAAAAVAASGISAILARYVLIERDASRLRTAFAHYLSPALVAALARDPDKLRLGGEQREMTFLFTDLEGFTSLAESADPKAIVAWLNDYLDGLCGIAMEHGGTIDKIVGDAVHVMFNAPLDQPDHADRAVRCALAIDAFAEAYSRDLRGRGVAFGATRVGVNTGLAVVGNFGGARRFDYTAHGDAINTAARLESANKALGTRICVARSTAEKAGLARFLPVGTLMLKGKSRGVDVFSPASGDSWGPAYREAFARLAGGDEAGSAAIVALAEQHPGQPVLALHARRIRAGERSTRMAA
jgi:adenylate cyclase